MHHADHAMIIPDASLASYAPADDQDTSTGWGTRLFWLGLGFGLGAVTAYLADPDRGTARRNELADRASSLAGDVQEQTVDRGRDAAQRAVGSAIDAVPEFNAPSDAVILERVRSQALGPSPVETSKLVTTVRDGGVVELRGEVTDPDARAEILATVRAVDGVADVVDLLHLPGEPAPTRS